jgi:hypothetical protein
MAAKIDLPLRFNQVKLMDVRIQMRGPSAEVMADFAYVDGEGTTFGKGSYNVLMDPAVRDALYAFTALCEASIVRAITVPMRQEAPPDDLGDSNVFMDGWDDQD